MLSETQNEVLDIQKKVSNQSMKSDEKLEEKTDTITMISTNAILGHCGTHKFTNLNEIKDFLSKTKIPEDTIREFLDNEMKYINRTLIGSTYYCYCCMALWSFISKKTN
jgi:hypothetical protein